MEILKSIIIFIDEHHPEAGLQSKDCNSFIISSGKERRQGYTRVFYTGNGWNISIGHSITLKPIYRIKADYNNGQIVWSGQIIDGLIEELGYDKQI